MIIIALMGRKGGITKTTLAVNIAAACAREGLRTLIIDADGQGNATSSARIQPHDGFYSLVMQDAEWNDVLVSVPPEFHGEGDLYLLPAWNGQRAVESHPETPTIIYERMQELHGVMDVAIVDTSPGITEIHTGFYYTADYVLLPTLCEYESIKSLESTMDFLDAARRASTGTGYHTAQILGIVPNRFSGRESVQQVNLGYLNGRYASRAETPVRVFAPMRNLTVWAQASQFRQSIYAYDPDHPNTRMQVKAAQKELAPVLEAVFNKVNPQVRAVTHE